MRFFRRAFVKIFTTSMTLGILFSGSIAHAALSDNLVGFWILEFE
jgi:hypothetical protein